MAHSKINPQIKSKIINLLKYIRNRRDYLLSVKISAKGKSNIISIHKLSRLRNSRILVKGDNNKVIIEEGCAISGLRMYLEGDGNTIKIGRNTIINASKLQPTIINAAGGRKILIGEGSLFSNNIEIHTTDYHGIYDTNGNRINPEKDIIISKRVWIGLGVKILKGTEIAEGCIIGAGSLISRKFEESNCIIAGNPAKVIAHDVIWDLKTSDTLLTR